MFRAEGSIGTVRRSLLPGLGRRSDLCPPGIGSDYPFDRTELRGLDTALANACLDYLNYDRLGLAEVHKHLANGERDLHRWLEEYRIEPAASRA